MVVMPADQEMLDMGVFIVVEVLDLVQQQAEVVMVEVLGRMQKQLVVMEHQVKVEMVLPVLETGELAVEAVSMVVEVQQVDVEVRQVVVEAVTLEELLNLKSKLETNHLLLQMANQKLVILEMDLLESHIWESSNHSTAYIDIPRFKEASDRNKHTRAFRPCFFISEF